MIGWISELSTVVWNPFLLLLHWKVTHFFLSRKGFGLEHISFSNEATYYNVPWFIKEGYMVVSCMINFPDDMGNILEAVYLQEGSAVREGCQLCRFKSKPRWPSSIYLSVLYFGGLTLQRRPFPMKTHVVWVATNYILSGDRPFMKVSVFFIFLRHRLSRVCFLNDPS